MITCSKENFLASLSLVVVISLVPALSQQPRRGPRERVIQAQDNIPVTNFSCAGRSPGYYADIETGCQVYHMCDTGFQFSYRCPDTTLFQQRMLICAHWYQVNCSRSEQHYNANLLIGQRDKPFVTEGDYANFNINDKEIKTLRSPEELQSLNANRQLIANNNVKVKLNNNLPTKTVNNNPNVNPTISNQNLNGNLEFSQTNNPNLNAQFSNQNFIPKVSPTQNTFLSTSGFKINNQFQNFNSNPNLPLNSASTFSNQNLIPKVSPTVNTFISTSSTNLNNQFQNFNLQTNLPVINAPQFSNIKPNVTPIENKFISSSGLNVNNPFQNFNLNPYFASPQFSNQNIPKASLTPSTSMNTNNAAFSTVPFIKGSTPTIILNITNKPTTQNKLVQTTPSTVISTISINQTNGFNFIKRFNPDDFTSEGFDKDSKINVSTYWELNNFIKRFDPNETEPQNETIQTENFITFLKTNIGPPSTEIELPIEETIQMESNNLELRFQDPRQQFYIPERNSQIIPSESATPITVNIPTRNIRQEFYPMRFVSPIDGDGCLKCHPLFLVNRVTCTPCVIVR